MIFLYFVTLKSIGLFCTLNGFFYPGMILLHYALVIWKILCHWVYIDLPNVSLYNTKKSHLFILLPISSEKSLSIDSPLNTQYWIQISKTLIFTWKLVFYPWQQYCQLFSLKLKAHFIFNKMSAKDSNLNKHALPASCSFK